MSADGLPPLLEDRGRDTVLCRLSGIEEPGGKAFRIKGRKEMFVVRFEGGVYGYQNSCPHAGVSLDWTPDGFFNYDRTLLMCAVHGARFRPEDGYCVGGPCTGAALTPVRIRVEHGVVMLDE